MNDAARGPFTGRGAGGGLPGAGATQPPPTPTPNATKKKEHQRPFDAVVRHGSISLAARELGLTQPATTRRIQNLE